MKGGWLIISFIFIFKYADSFAIPMQDLSAFEPVSKFIPSFCKSNGKNGSINATLLREAGMSSLVQAYVANALKRLERTGCSKTLKQYICALFAPTKIESYGILPPCKSVCEQIEKSCETILQLGSKFASKEDCRVTETGADYRGKINVTKNGVPCQKWKDNEPHSHPLITPKSHPNDGLERNYCRNPDGEPKGPWCYTTSKKQRWDYCTIPRCQVHLHCKYFPEPSETQGCLDFEYNKDLDEYQQVLKGTPTKSQKLESISLPADIF